MRELKVEAAPPHLDEALRLAAGRIMAAKLMAGLVGLSARQPYGYQAEIHNQVTAYLIQASQIRPIPLDELTERFYQWAGTTPNSLLDCANLIYHRAMTDEPLPWENDNHE